MFQFIPVAQAQEATSSADATAQPTFGPIAIIGGGTGDQNVQVILSSNTTQIGVGSRVTVSIELKTGADISASEYQLVLTYDPQSLTPIDQDPAVSGTQVKLVDTLFTVPPPTQDNNYATTNTGIILIKARGDFPLTINRKVVEIEFQAQRMGSSEVKVDTTPIQGTRIRRGNTDIAYTPSTLTLQVGEAINNPGCNTNSDCASGQVCVSNVCTVEQTASCTQNSDCTSGWVCRAGTCVAPQLPRTALFDQVGLPAGIFALALIAFGLYLHRSRDARH